MIILSEFMRSLLEKYCPHHVIRVEYTLVCTKLVAYNRIAKIDKTFSLSHFHNHTEHSSVCFSEKTNNVVN